MTIFSYILAVNISDDVERGKEISIKNKIGIYFESSVTIMILAFIIIKEMFLH
jgi:hypothetical protein